MAPSATHRSLALDRAPDDAHLRRAVQGDGGAFAALFARHAPRAYAVARGVLGPTPAAEDAAQEAMLQLWRSADSYAPERGSLRAYVAVLARSRALDHLRREAVRTAATERATEHGRLFPKACDDEVERRQRNRELHDGMTRLPREQAQVLGLQFLAGRSQTEVARLLDVPLGTVKGRARLGLDKLRRDLEVATA